MDEHDDEDEQEARRARAARLRRQIDRLKGGADAPEDPDAPKEPESPREFVERRMRETRTPEDGE